MMRTHGATSKRVWSKWKNNDTNQISIVWVVRNEIDPNHWKKAWVSNSLTKIDNSLAILKALEVYKRNLFHFHTLRLQKYHLSVFIFPVSDSCPYLSRLKLYSIHLKTILYFLWCFSAHHGFIHRCIPWMRFFELLLVWAFSFDLSRPQALQHYFTWLFIFWFLHQTQILFCVKILADFWHQQTWQIIKISYFLSPFWCLVLA